MNFSGLMLRLIIALNYVGFGAAYLLALFALSQEDWGMAWKQILAALFFSCFAKALPRMWGYIWDG